MKLFRKIRQGLLANQNSGKYLKYAIGEILLVVIGILIALQINNWNEKRKFHNLKQVYLERLISDLKKDTSQINARTKLVDEKQAIIKNFVGNLEGETSANKLFESLHQFTGKGWLISDFSPNMNTYNDLSQTGNMNVFRNNDLISQIKDYYISIDDYLKGHQMNKDWVLPSDFNLSQQSAIFAFDPYTKDLFSTKDSSFYLQDLSKNKTIYIGNAAGHYWLNASFIKDLEMLKAESTKLLEMLEEELKN